MTFRYSQFNIVIAHCEFQRAENCPAGMEISPSLQQQGNSVELRIFGEVVLVLQSPSNLLHDWVDNIIQSHCTSPFVKVLRLT